MKEEKERLQEQKGLVRLLSFASLFAQYCYPYHMAEEPKSMEREGSPSGVV